MKYPLEDINWTDPNTNHVGLSINSSDFSLEPYDLLINDEVIEGVREVVIKVS